jgi:hypothetical protein
MADYGRPPVVGRNSAAHSAALPLARRYRPQRLAVEGRVNEPMPDCPWQLTVRPWSGGVMVGAGGSDRYVDARSMDDRRVDDVAAFLIAELRAAGVSS